MSADDRKPPYRLVLVEWVDSAQPVPRWLWTDDYEIPAVVRCVSVGFLIAESRDAIALAPNLGDVLEDRRQASGIIRIPRSAIRGTRVLPIRNAAFPSRRRGASSAAASAGYATRPSRRGNGSRRR
jgi:hypothetical protein